VTGSADARAILLNRHYTTAFGDVLRLNVGDFGGRTRQPAAIQELRRHRRARRRGLEMLRKILAVDDSALIHQMYKLFLSRYKNCKLISAMNGLEALDKLAQEEGIDLILLDINMPVMNGLEFLQKVQKEPAYQAIPVIIISTEGKEEDTIRGLKMGAKGYVKKPFQASELHGLIEKITSP
jgi:two-component system chemotaxis response regulator CheY